MKLTALLVSVVMAASPLSGPAALPWGISGLPATTQIAGPARQELAHAPARKGKAKRARGRHRADPLPAHNRTSVSGPGIPASPEPRATRSSAGSSGAASSFTARRNECRGDAVCLRILQEYGAVFAATNVRLPNRVIFPDEQAVRGFQSQTGAVKRRIGSVTVELQPAAMRALEAAIREAQGLNLFISPKGTDAARRSYSDTVGLWRQRVNGAIAHWVAAGRLTRRDAEQLRALSPVAQVPEVLRLEAKGLYFSTNFDKSILQSVAAPGTSQHLSMLALDLAQHADPRVRELLARHGWYQTVSSDLPHFTYLGVSESALRGRGLKRHLLGGRTFWVPDLKLRASAAERPAHDRSAAGTPGDARKVGTVGGSRVRMAGNVVLTPREAPLVKRLAQAYFDRTGSTFYVTSGYRTPAQQASAMYGNLVRYGIPYVRRTYGGRPAAVEIIAAFIRNRRFGRRAILTMTAIIEDQIDRGVYVSRHLRGMAVDIRMSTAQRQPLSGSAAQVGGDLVIEIDHYHVQFAG